MFYVCSTCPKLLKKSDDGNNIQKDSFMIVKPQQVFNKKLMSTRKRSLKLNHLSVSSVLCVLHVLMRVDRPTSIRN